MSHEKKKKKVCINSIAQSYTEIYTANIKMWDRYSPSKAGDG